MDSKSLSHTRWKCQYHIVFIPKYRKKQLLGSKWNKSFWAKGYYVATVGNLIEEAIKKYIQEQSEEFKKENDQVTAFLR